MTLKAWKEICKPKDLGGLGFQRFIDFNTALLAKLGWKLASGEENLWTRILKAKYLQRSSFFEHNLKKGSSSIWRDIISARKALLKGFCFKFGDGLSIKPWCDLWVPGMPNGVPGLKDRVRMDSWLIVSDFRDKERNGWNISRLREFYEKRVVIEIQKLVWPPFPYQDKLL